MMVNYHTWRPGIGAEPTDSRICQQNIVETLYMNTDTFGCIRSDIGSLHKCCIAEIMVDIATQMFISECLIFFEHIWSN